MSNGTFVQKGNSSPQDDKTNNSQKVHPNFYEGYYFGEAPSIVVTDNTKKLPRIAPPYCNPDDYHDSDHEPKPVTIPAVLPSEPERGLNPFPGWKGPEDDEFLIDL